MAICSDWCCNAEKREARTLEARLAFARHQALARGQTVDRVVPAEPMSSVLLRPSESQNIRPEESSSVVRFGHGPMVPVVKPRCTCTDCPCDNVRTITSPQRCADCLKGMHVTAGGA